MLFSKIIVVDVINFYPDIATIAYYWIRTIVSTLYTTLAVKCKHMLTSIQACTAEIEQYCVHIAVTSKTYLQK